jgi:hypothetical protein
MKIGWALFALVLIGMIGYGLNRGVYVGSEVFSDMDGRFRKQCKYLFPSGVTRKISARGSSEPRPKMNFVVSSMTRAVKAHVEA